MILPRRWIVERSIAWLNRCRWLAKDLNNLNRNRSGIGSTCFDPAHATKALQSFLNFRIEL